MFGKLLDTGKQALITAINTNTPLVVDHIDIGTTFGVKPLSVETGVAPAISQVIAGAFLYKTKVSLDEVVFTIILDHTVSGNIGNLVPVVQGNKGLFKVVFPISMYKNPTTAQKSSPGDMYFIHFRLNFPNLLKACSNIPDYVVDMKHYENFDSIEFNGATEYEQYIVENQSGRMVLTSKINGVHYGIPWSMNLKDKGFWRYFGGDAGDNYEYIKKEVV